MDFPLFLVPILSGLLAQALKPLINKRWYQTLTPQGRFIPRYGGMPSAHSAFAASLATVVAIADGVTGATFAIAAAVFIFILDDALRMRIFLGRHGQALRHFIEKLPSEEQATLPYVEARLGHRPTEVIAGASLGVIVTALILLLVI